MGDCGLVNRELWVGRWGLWVGTLPVWPCRL